MKRGRSKPEPTPARKIETEADLRALIEETWGKKVADRTIIKRIDDDTEPEK